MAVRLDHGSDDLTETHEINVTPFIDVMLVLLIIFMVAAPLATVGILSAAGLLLVFPLPYAPRLAAGLALPAALALLA